MGAGCVGKENRILVVQFLAIIVLAEPSQCY